jgi:2'-5' RNA ligase
MRLFTAIDLPSDIQEQLEHLLARLRPTAALRWSPIENLHITTKFIGEWPEERLEELKTALRGIPKRAAIPIGVSGLGWFPNPHNPRVFWAAIHGGPALTEVATATEDALEPLGIERERRPYSPHLTLARIGEPVPLQAIRRAIADTESLEFGSFTADRFYLYLSKPGRAGSVYTQLSQFVFVAE